MSLPILLKKKIRALIVGGGTVALRKCERLLKSGAQVTLESPELHDNFEPLKAEYAQNLQILLQVFQPRVLTEYDLIFACTNNRDVNSAVCMQAREASVPVNVCDAPQECDFILPASFESTAINASFSCNGLPALAANLRDAFERSLPLNSERTIEQLKSLREKITSGDTNHEQRTRILRELCTINTLKHCANLDQSTSLQYLLSLLEQISHP